MGIETGALIGAGVAAAGTAASVYSSQQQQRGARKSRRIQQEQFNKQEALQKKQLQVAETEKQKLQVEESDAIRSARRRGRRSLISGSEQGVDVLGQRVGEL